MFPAVSFPCHGTFTAPWSSHRSAALGLGGIAACPHPQRVRRILAPAYIPGSFLGCHFRLFTFFLIFFLKEPVHTLAKLWADLV